MIKIVVVIYQMQIGNLKKYVRSIFAGCSGSGAMTIGQSEALSKVVKVLLYLFTDECLFKCISGAK
jgi:hypothetical protein